MKNKIKQNIGTINQNNKINFIFWGGRASNWTECQDWSEEGKKEQKLNIIFEETNDKDKKITMEELKVVQKESKNNI